MVDLYAFEAFLDGFIRDRDLDVVEEARTSECAALIRVSENPSLELTQMAIRLQLPQSVKWLMDHVQLDEDRRSLLVLEAAQADNGWVIERLVHDVSLVTVQDAMEICCRRRHACAMRALLARYTPSNLPGTLMASTIHRHTDMVQCLLEHRLDVAGIPGSLMIAAGRGYTDMVETLIHHLDASEQFHLYARDQSLINASRHGHKYIAKMLVEMGANPQARSGRCLQLAHPDVLPLLVSYT